MSTQRANLPPANRIVPALLLASALHAAVILGVRVELPKPAARPEVLELSLASNVTERSPVNPEIPLVDRESVRQDGVRAPLSDGSDATPSRAQSSALQGREPERVAAVSRPADAAATPSGRLLPEEARPEHGVRRGPVTSADARRREKSADLPSVAAEVLTPRSVDFATVDVEPPKRGQRSEGRQAPPVRLSAAALDQQISEWSAAYNHARESEAAPPARTAYVEKVVSNRVSAAAYERAWQEKVERVGNMNYPEEARRKNLSGGLILSVGISADGSIQSIQVRKSSGHEELDQAAIRIVRLAAPFSRFPPELKKDYDVLLITRTWRFFIDHHLATSP